jgi:DNA-3-methyladenine glycosylase I
MPASCRARKKKKSRIKNHNMKNRCPWAESDPLYIQYHDMQWGVPLHDDQKLFEMLLLEGAQAGLSWITILKKRKNYQSAFDNFDPDLVAGYDTKKIEELLNNNGIVRNRLKIVSAIENARAFIKVRDEFGSFDKYIWRFCGNKPIVNSWLKQEDIPSKTPESVSMSMNLKKRGFKFVGPVICYAFMQAVGMVNDHLTYCFRYWECTPWP